MTTAVAENPGDGEIKAMPSAGASSAYGARSCKNKKKKKKVKPSNGVANDGACGVHRAKEKAKSSDGVASVTCENLRSQVDARLPV